jgi:hypothetical protein
VTLAETTPTRDNGGLTAVRVKSNAYKLASTRVRVRSTRDEVTSTRVNARLTAVRMKSNACKLASTRVKVKSTRVSGGLTRCKLTPNAVRRGSDAYNGPWSRSYEPLSAFGVSGPGQREAWNTTGRDLRRRSFAPSLAHWLRSQPRQPPKSCGLRWHRESA